MPRGLIRGLLVPLLAAALVAHARAERPRDDSTGAKPSPLLQRFLALDDPSLSAVRALRHLEAHNDHFDSSAWMEVWTDADSTRGFRYLVVAEGGSDYIRSHVLRAALDTEREMWATGAADRAALTPENYVFEEGGAQPDGLRSLLVKPRRKDVLLVNGSIFLDPQNCDLVRLEGRLAKSPSFWTRHVEIVRWFGRFAGVRMPVAVESAATVLVAGRSTFRMTYEYEMINGERVGHPQPRTR